MPVPPEFPSRQLPAEAAAQRLLGLYPQRQPGRLMQRVVVPGGRLTAEQWRRLGQLAARFADRGWLHLTTRQDLELHGLTAEVVPAVQGELADAGLTTLRACGDTLRNLVVCPGAGQCPGSADLFALAMTIKAAVEAHPEVHHLPRKFKICLSGCERSCAKPWISDLGFVAVADGRLRAIGSGSLGPRPAAAVPLYETLTPAEAVALALGAVDLFTAEGDRQNRRQARLRHVRERLGDEEFRRRLDTHFRRRSTDPAATAAPPLPQPRLDGQAGVRLQCPLGDLTSQQADLVADLAAQPGVAVRIDTEHGLWLYGVSLQELPAALGELAGEPRVVACPGTDYCASAIAGSRRLATAIADRLRRDGRPGLEAAIAVSGCLNGCAHSSAAAIGLLPRLRQKDGRAVEYYQILTGGDAGRGPGLATARGEPASAEDVPELIAALVKSPAT